jgi:outer membrane receptor protein involved in Fe transport
MRLIDHILGVCSVLFVFASFGQDTSKVFKPIPVFAQKDTVMHLADLTSAVPHFSINAEKADELGVVDVGEALKIIPGVQIRDYGGIGGVKSISFRSLGAAHTTVVMDGNAIPNLRSGSINLSQFELFGLEKVSFSSGQVMDDYTTASAFAQANTIALRSVLFTPPKKMRFQTYLNGTTINAYEGGLMLQKRLGKHFFIGGQGMVRLGNGEYDFIHPELPNEPVFRRENTALNSTRVRVLMGYDNAKTRMTLEAYLNNVDQELPGAAVVFNPSNDQTLETNNMRFTGNFSHSKGHWRIRSMVGFDQKLTRYFDPFYLNLDGFIDARYQERVTKAGFLISRSFRYPKEQLFIGSDLLYGNLNGNQLKTNPNRVTNISVLGASTLVGSFKIDANLTTQYIYDQFIEADQRAEREFFKLSPFIAVVYKPFKESSLRIRSFYKHTFRMPSFNDLYYNFIGNTRLEPEEAQLFNLGLTWGIQRKRIRLELTADGYYNLVENKIVAIPTRDLFNWSMQNIGKTDIRGVDFGALVALKWKEIIVHLNSNHSFNESIDITNPESITFGQQIPYTPFYSGSNGLTIGYNGYKISINALISGFRYSLNENIYANYLPGFIDLNVGLSKNWSLKSGSFLIDLKIMNILNKNYQVIRSFPMPGRYLQIRLKYNLSQ